MIQTIETIVTYPADAVLNEEQVAAALQISVEKVKKADLPVIYFGRDKRYVWSMVLETLKERAAA